ncbi:MAG: hypothetical protein M1136_08490 [Chloroflexi bacterium]|nr:hypothetical protein [Chloroflexota bacterium]MCL5075668.1 hypothetical protein [Chloroflexota bacterium]
MKGFLRWLALLLAPLFAARLIDLILRTPWGKNLAEQTDSRFLTTGKGRGLIGKYTKKFIKVLARTVERRRQRATKVGMEPLAQGTGWVGLLADVAELMLATGTMIKVVTDFLKEKRRTT